MKPFTIYRSPYRRSAGFSLIEIMVGLLIGMLAVIVIMQVFAGAEANKRRTTGGDDAQINGMVALYALERDVREAGYGINAFNLLGCTLTYSTTVDARPVTLGNLAPVTINPATSLLPAGDAGTDTLLVIAGSSSSPTEGDLVSSAPGTGTYPVTTPGSFAIGDYVIAQPASRPTTCSLALSKITAKNASTLAVSPGDATGLALGSVVFNLGPTPIARAYAIRNGGLTMCDYTAYDCGSATYVSPLDTTVWVPIASNIVSLRAQYGRDITGTASSQMTGVVGTYDQLTPGSSADTSSLAIQCRWARAIAVRMALVARSIEYDRNEVTTVAPTWAGSAISTDAPTNPVAVEIGLSGNGDWKHYRYKTLQTTAPLRNLIWQGSQTTLQGGNGAC